MTIADGAAAALAWYDARLQVTSDHLRRRRYRALQSWYRETQFGVEPGQHDRHPQLVGSMLPKERALAGLNFLHPEIASYVERRIREVRRANGTLDEDRLRRNMLSSMPLCFNLFGAFRAKRPAAARALRAVLGLDIDTIDQVMVEHAPRAAKAVLGDRTAFDAFVAYTTSTGAKGFLGVETKYTEPFGPKTHRPAYYEANPAYHWAGFHPGAGERLGRQATNQLWRNTLLAAATRHTDDYDFGHAVVIAGRDDSAAWKAVAAVRSELHHPDRMLQSVSLERLIEQCRLQRSLAEWAAQFHRRYLDLSSIAEHFWVPTTPEEQPVVPLGTIVSGRPSGWDRKGHPDGPGLDGIPDIVSGPLQGWLVDEPDHGLHYFKHIVAGLDVDPATIETPH
jgi:PD-(D/E)XK nuclease superfamily